MSRDQIVADALTAISSGQAQVLTDAVGAAVDASALEQKASDGTLGQGDLDAAVAAAVAPLNAQIAQDATDLAAAHADADAKLAALQTSFDALTIDDTTKTAEVKNFTDSVAALSAALDAFKALIPAA